MGTISFSRQGYSKNHDSKTRVFRILRDKRKSHIKFPAMLNIALKHGDINGVYIPLMIEPGHLVQAIHLCSNHDISVRNMKCRIEENNIIKMNATHKLLLLI